MIWYVLCGGPSLTEEDLDRVKGEQSAGRGKVIAVNRQIFYAPWADICYAWDMPFWRKYWQDIRKVSPYCEFVTSSPNCSRYGSVKLAPRGKKAGFDPEGVVGNNSGHRAINLAYIEGMKLDPLGDFEIVTLGFDCQHVGGKAHHYGDNPPKTGNAQNPQNWAEQAIHLAVGLNEAGIRVTNCSPLTILKCFAVMSLEEKLGY